MLSPQGFQRVYDELPEINLDVPHAHSIMESFVDLCYQESVITKQLRDACPSRLVSCQALCCIWKQISNQDVLQHIIKEDIVSLTMYIHKNIHIDIRVDSTLSLYNILND